MITNCTFNEKPNFLDYDLEDYDFKVVWVGNNVEVGPDHEIAIKPGDEAIIAGLVFVSKVEVWVYLKLSSGKYFGAVNMNNFTAAPGELNEKQKELLHYLFD